MTTILVTGATGTIGSALVPNLLARGADVRAFARDPHRAAGLAAAGADVIPGDFADLASVRHAMSGVDAVFLACGNVPDQVDHERAVIDAAQSAGVQRIVKLSARGADPGASVAYWRRHAEIEQHLRASGVPAVMLRPGFLMTNLLAAADHVREQGMMFAPAGRARIGMVHPADVADAAAAALTQAGHDGRTYVLTGPEAIGYADVATALSAAVGRPVTYVDIPPEAALPALVEAGLPAFAAEQVVQVFDALRGGAQAETTDTVAALTGSPARPIGTFVEQYAAAFGAASEPVRV